MTSNALWFAVFTLISVSRVAAQDGIGVELCACQPTSVTIRLNFSAVCEENNVSGPGIIDSACLVGANDDVTDKMPIRVSMIQIEELTGDSLAILENTTLMDAGGYVDGEEISYTSIIERIPESITADEFPRGLRVILTGVNANEETLENTWIVIYDNSCGIYPVVTTGQQIGWSFFADVGEPSVLFCPPVNVTTPPDSTAVPSDPSLTSTPSDTGTTEPPNTTEPPASSSTTEPPASSPTAESAGAPTCAGKGTSKKSDKGSDRFLGIGQDGECPESTKKDRTSTEDKKSDSDVRKSSKEKDSSKGKDDEVTAEKGDPDKGKSKGNSKGNTADIASGEPMNSSTSERNHKKVSGKEKDGMMTSSSTASGEDDSDNASSGKGTGMRKGKGGKRDKGSTEDENEDDTDRHQR